MIDLDSVSRLIEFDLVSPASCLNSVLPRLKILVLGVLVFLGGCRSYTQSTPSEYFEGDNGANYQRIFKTTVPADVTVVNSVVVGYSMRPGVVTTDDFEIELIAPPDRIKLWKKYLYANTLGVAERKAHPIRPWYAPKLFDAYRSYTDRSSVGYVHLLEEIAPEPDGRIRVFLSKHGSF
jgi:hypothetical protein